MFSLRVIAARGDASTQLVAAQIPGNVQQNALISAKTGGNTNSSFHFIKSEMIRAVVFLFSILFYVVYVLIGGKYE